VDDRFLEEQSMARPRTFAALAAAALVAVSCGGGGGGTPTSPSGGGAGGGTGGGGTQTPVTISITGQGGKLAFSPNPATVAAGQMVVFKNNDTVAHHVTMDDGTISTPDIAPGATSAPVTIGNNKSYHCTIHPGMVGGFNGTEVEVPPNCNQAYCFGGG
jgi:plastocyanin